MSGENAQGIEREVSYKKQTGKGSAASGSGGQLVRRVTFNPNVTKGTYSSNEIVSHQQHTGDVHGIAQSAATLNGELSPGTYGDFFAALLRKAAAATSSITGLSLTIAASGSAWTITRGTGDFLTGGIKKGDVIRLAGGSLSSENVGINLVVTGVTATVLTVVEPTGAGLTAEGPIASCTVSVPGKKIWVPTSGHTSDWFTFEDWFSDLNGGSGRSHLYPDVQVSSCAISMPTTGIITSNFSMTGLGERTKGGTRILTSPTAETTTPVLSSVSGIVLIGGTQYAIITQADITIDGQITAGQATIGSTTVSDNQRNKVKVSGSFSYLFVDDTLAEPFEDETATDLTFFFCSDRTGTGSFVSIRIPRAKLFTDEGDDGEKQIVRSANFTAEINGSGGAALSDHQTIVSMQDSAIA